jgi:hypothetical protein
MKTYEVTEHKRDRKTVTVDASDEFEAVKKAHEQITGKATDSQVLWHGLTAEIDGVKYNKPVVVWDEN